MDEHESACVCEKCHRSRLERSLAAAEKALAEERAKREALEAVTRRLPPPMDVYVLPLAIHDMIRDLQDENGRDAAALDAERAKREEVEGNFRLMLEREDSLRNERDAERAAHNRTIVERDAEFLAHVETRAKLETARRDALRDIELVIDSFERDWSQPWRSQLRDEIRRALIGGESDG